MNIAWETTIDDVSVVLQQNKSVKGNERLAEILAKLDTDEIERAALDGGNTIEEQTISAYNEMAKQLKGLKIIRS